MYNNALKARKQTIQLIIMFIVGQVNNQEELNEITFIAKLFVVGQRARELANETKKNK
ncbi:MAG: hypothetical protein MUO82_11305 [Candidatus Thermoplasmatota archaeon]|nr:hypothetical protein [Candidatus Thermoplasmatota archaeon]